MNGRLFSWTDDKTRNLEESRHLIWILFIENTYPVLVKLVIKVSIEGWQSYGVLTDELVGKDVIVIKKFEIEFKSLQLIYIHH